MTIQDLGSIGEFVAAIATLATLVYLALQIRQNTRSVRASTHHAFVISGNAISFALAETEAAQLVIKAARSYGDLTPEEKFPYSMLMRASFAWYEDTYLQFRAAEE